MADDRLRRVSEWLLTAGPAALAYPERNKYTIKRQLAQLFEVCCACLPS